MDITKIIEQLRAERQQIEIAILALEAVGKTQTRQPRGRPPKWRSELRRNGFPAEAVATVKVAGRG